MAIYKVDYLGKPGLQPQDPAGFGRLLSEKQVLPSNKQKVKLASTDDYLRWNGKLAQHLDAPQTDRARMGRPDRRAVYHLPLVEGVVKTNTLPQFKELLRNTSTARGVNGIEQLTNQLMLKTGYTTERIMRSYRNLPEQIEGFPLSLRTWPDQPQIHEVLLQKAEKGRARVDRSYVFAIHGDALRELQNDLWRNIQSTDAYRRGLDSLID